MFKLELSIPFLGKFNLLRINIIKYNMNELFNNFIIIFFILKKV